jgi:thiol-disulfide isomerase/thioredoxin
MSDTPAQTDTMTDETMSAGAAMTDTMMSAGAAMTDTMTHEETMGAGEMMTATHPMTESASGAMMDGEAMSAVMELPAWQTMPLTDARTGATFTLADFVGKTVFVETMATWCPNCRQQLGNVKSAAARADAEQVLFIAISVETDLPAATLAQYADDNGFDWTFAVATPEFVRALADTFGQTVANPPATPHFWIQPDGAHSDLATGYESGDEILAQLGG